MKLWDGAQLRIEDMKRAIRVINDRVKLAKKEKREADVAKLTTERAAAEREKSLLKRRSSLRDAGIDLQKKRTESADLDRKMPELELQLAMKRAARPAPIWNAAITIRARPSWSSGFSRRSGRTPQTSVR